MRIRDWSSDVVLFRSVDGDHEPAGAAEGRVRITNLEPLADGDVAVGDVGAAWLGVVHEEAALHSERPEDRLLGIIRKRHAGDALDDLGEEQITAVRISVGGSRREVGALLRAQQLERGGLVGVRRAVDYGEADQRERIADACGRSGRASRGERVCAYV